MDAREQMRGIWRLAGCVVMAGICLMPVLGKAQTSAEESATERLRSLMTTALSAARAGDKAKLEEVAHALVIPNYEAWFKETFGEWNGTKLAAAYKADFERQEKWLPTLFESLSKQNGQVLVEDVREPRYSGIGNWCGRVLLRAAKGETQFTGCLCNKRYTTGLIDWTTPDISRSWKGLTAGWIARHWGWVPIPSPRLSRTH